MPIVLDSLEAAAIELIGAPEDRSAWSTRARLTAQNPGLAYRDASRSDASTTLLHRVANRTGTDPDVDIYPGLVCRSAEVVVQSVMESYVGGLVVYLA